jgi:hypothetical protein
MTDDQQQTIAGILLLVIIILLWVALRRAKQKQKQYEIPANYIRVQFSKINQKIPVGGNTGKVMIIMEDGVERIYPYHPMLLGIFRHFKNMAVLDETLGQDSLPLPLLGEIKASNIEVHE